MSARDPEASAVHSQPAGDDAGRTGNGSDVARPNQNSAAPKASYASLYNKKQLAVLCLARLAEPLAATSIQVRLLIRVDF